MPKERGICGPRIAIQSPLGLPFLTSLTAAPAVALPFRTSFACGLTLPRVSRLASPRSTLLPPRPTVLQTAHRLLLPSSFDLRSPRSGLTSRLNVRTFMYANDD